MISSQTLGSKPKSFFKNKYILNIMLEQIASASCVFSISAVIA